jgi:adenylate cyclase
VDIDDGTEIGELQAGFNDMVAGLREREQLRDLFGRHVGVDVARAAVAGGVQLGGEVREVTVLFVDVMGSTTMATELDPTEVVTLLNRFFDVVIDVVHAHGGWINKFEGDAALAIWGAPVEVADRNAQALAAARVLSARLRAEVPEIAAGVGISGGPVVSGNVGSADRYEYTVIGDPVNEAARLTSVAKEHPERCVANAALLSDAAREAGNWVERDPLTVRGRTSETRIAVPCA